MLMVLLIGGVTLVVCLAIQVFALVLILRYLLRWSAQRRKAPGILASFWAICFVALASFLSHLVQTGIWAALFVRLGQFADFSAAYYHSLVNLSSLGYGDVVMEDPWRLLGAMEAASGVLLFGVTAGALVAIMSSLFSQGGAFRQHHRHGGSSRAAGDEDS